MSLYISGCCWLLSSIECYHWTLSGIWFFVRVKKKLKQFFKNIKWYWENLDSDFCCCYLLDHNIYFHQHWGSEYFFRKKNMFWLLLKTHMWLLIIGECWINSDVDPWIWQRRGRMGKELQGNITSGSCKKSFQEDLFWLIIYLYYFIWPPNTEIQMIVPKQQQKNPPSNKKWPNHNLAICVINMNIFF